MGLSPIARSLSVRSLAIALSTFVSGIILSFPELSKIFLPLSSSLFSLSVLAQTHPELKAQADELLMQGSTQWALSDVQGAINSWQQALNLYRQIGDKEFEVIMLVTLGEVYQHLEEYGTAIDYYEESLEIARENGDGRGEVSALSNLGAVYKILQKYTTAIEYYHEVLALNRESGNRFDEIATLDNLGNIHQQLEEYDTAIDYYEQSLAIAQGLAQEDDHYNFVAADALDNLAKLYNFLGEYARAVEYYQQRLPLREETGFGREDIVLGNLGGAYDSLSEYATAIESFQQSLTIAQQTGNRGDEGNALSDLGIAYDALGEYATAIEFLQQSLAIAHETGDRALEGKALGGLGVVYLNLGEYHTAIDYQQQRLTIARERSDRIDEGKALADLGNVYNSLGEYLTAIEYHQQSLAIAREIGALAESEGTVADRALEGMALNNLGITYLKVAGYSAAVDYYQQSLAIARERGDRADEGIILGNLGTAHLILGENTTAIEYLQQSLAITRSLGNRAAEGIALNNLGVAFLNSLQPNEAEATLREAIAVHESIRKELGENDAWKVSIFEQQAITYRLLVQALLHQNRPEDALEISERGRARSFIELMAKHSLNESETTEKIDFPNLEKIKQVAQQQNAVLVEYLLINDRSLFIWVVQPTGAITFRWMVLTVSSLSEIPLTELAERGRLTAATSRIRGSDETEMLVSEMVRGTRDSIGSSSTVAPPTTTNQSRINRHLRQLHEFLIEPIADLLPSDPNQNVIFIPHGALFLVPFAALQDTSGKYLIEKHTILTAPAIQVLELTQQQEPNQNGEILIVGNPTMPKISLAANQPPQQLNPLPGTEAEATAIAALLNTDFLSGDRATETAIKQKMPDAKLIHLATHGLLEQTDNGLLAAIALTPSSNDDGLLTPEEILSLDLNADLVVLSACDTGIGKITGDGVLGLSRSILTAGARSAIVSLWKVPDTPTSVLMSEFYRQWQQTGNKAQALRQAMLTTMEQYPHPMNWAAFTIMGESN